MARLGFLQRLWTTLTPARATRRPTRGRMTRPALERLEDRTVPALTVVSAAPAPEWVAVPMTSVELTFDNPVNPSTVQPADLVLLRNGSSFGSVSAAEVVPGTNNQRVRFTLGGLTTSGQLTTLMRPGSILAANGDPNDPYTASYTLTSIGFSAVEPLGSLIYTGSRSGQTFTFAVDAGQAITLVANGLPGPTALSVTLRGPATASGPGPVLGSATAPQLGASAVLQSVLAPGTGLYTATVTGGPVTTGPTLKVLLNAAQELEGTGPGFTNNTPASAQDLSAAFVALTPASGSPDRGGLAGTFTGSPDHYAVPLAAGQSMSVALAQANPNDRVFNPAVVVSQNPQAGTSPTDVAVGDLNGDGLPDLVHSLSVNGAGALLVQYRTGNGSYFQGVLAATDGALVRAVRLGDLNGDGRLDAVVANESTGTVGVLLGTGNDPFTSEAPLPSFGNVVIYQAGPLPRDLALGDLDGDSDLDLVVGRGQGNLLGVLLNNGNGTFAPVANYLAGGFISNGVAIGDVTGDGKPDIVAVTVDNASLSVLPGLGNGTFAGPVVDPSGGSNPRDVVLGDFNGDGRLDAVVGHGPSQVVAFLNQNNGVDPFGPGTVVSGGFGVNKLAAADFNGDGRLDLAATFAVTSGPFARVYLGDGAGLFPSQIDFPLSGPTGTPAALFADGIAAADVNGDGAPDLATANTGSSNLTVLTNALSRLRVDVVDANGNVLAAGTPSDNATSGVTDFVAPAAGTYYVRVGGEGRSDYAAVVTRGAVFEVERNDTSATARPLDGGGGVLGHVSARERFFTVVAGTPGQIQELDAAGAVLRTFPVPNGLAVAPESDPIGLAFDGTSLFFTNWFKTHNLYELDPDTGAVRDVDVIPIPFNGIDGLAALNGKVYISDGAGGNALLSFDPVTDTFGPILTISSINPNGAGDLFGGLAGITGPDRLVATAATNNGMVRVVEIDPLTGVITSSFTPGLPAQPPIPNGAVRGVAVVDGEIHVARIDGGFRTEVYSRSGTHLRTILTPAVTALGGDDLGGSVVDWYTITTGAAQEIRLATTTPADGTADFANTLNPRIELFNPDGILVATGSPGPDGRNETLTFSSAGGTYRVRVTGQNNSAGEYFLAATLGPASAPPIAGDDAASTDEDNAVTVAVLGNDSDPDGDPLTVSAVTQGSHGVVAVNANGTLSYTPAANYHGTDAFTYTVTDGRNGFDTATVTVTVRSVNDAPVGAADAYATDEDTPLVVAVAAGVLANDVEADGDPLAASLVAGPAHGTLTLNANGSFTYTPASNYNGPDSFTYRATDGVAASAVVAVSLTVRSTNDTPNAADDTASTNEDTPVAVTVLGNDSDPDGDPLAVSAVTQGSHGVVAVNANGTLSYTPAANYHGTDAFSYTITDGRGGSDTATVTITVSPVNDPPTAGADAGPTDEDTAVTVAVLANDRDLDGDPLTVSAVTQGAHGSVAINPDGTVTYTPAADYHGQDSFTYTASDGKGGLATATVTVTVNPVNDRPTVQGATFSVPENSPNGTVVGTVVATDVDGDALSYSIVGGNGGGAFAIDAATGRITVANSALLDFETTPQFTLTVQVRDPAGLTAAATVTVNLTDVPPRLTIDVIPGSAANEISLKKTRTFEVAILSSSEFDARNVDRNSIRFGRTGQENSVSRHPKQGLRFRLGDVNDDGRLDLVVTVETDKTGLQVGDTTAVLTCRLLGDPTLFSEEDEVFVRRN